MSNDDDEAGFFEALQFIENMDPRYRICRGGRNHNFLDGEQTHGEQPTKGSTYTETRCARCDVIKCELTTLRGYYIQRPHYKYPKTGYLMTSDESRVIGQTDLAAATRVIRRYEKMGKDIPRNLRSPGRKG